MTAMPSTQPTGGAWSTVVERLNEMAVEFLKLLPNLVGAIIVLVIFYFVANLVRAVVTRVANDRLRYRNLGLLFARLAHGATIIIGVMVAAVFVIPTFTVASLIQFLGIGTVAIGFAFQNILQNYLAGILLLLTEPFRIGDQIAMQSFEGTVEDIQARATLLKTYDGRRVVIPNADMFTNPVTVNTAFQNRRLEYDVGIGYGDDLEKAKQLILDALRSVDGVLPDPAPEALAYDLAGSSVTIRARWWFEPGRQKNMFVVRDQVISAIKKSLSENGIDMPYPTQQVLFHDQTEETDGDRSAQREGWAGVKGKTPKPRTLAGAIYELARGSRSASPSESQSNPAR